MMPYSPPTTTADTTHQSKRLELYHRLLKFKNKNVDNKGQLKKSIKVKVSKPNQKKIDDTFESEAGVEYDVLVQ